jgi:Kef-type K+ transport system membrane component KefB
METASPLLLNLGLLVTCGLLAGLIAERLGLPRILAYVATGMLFSPGLLGGYAGIGVNAWSEPLTDLALGIIAYLIGGSMSHHQLQRMGRVILGSAFGEALGAVLLVFVAMLLLAPMAGAAEPTKLALVLAVMAATTAPAATVAVLHQYRAQGPLATTLLGVVALDDALGMLLFSLLLVLSLHGSLSAGLTAGLASIGASLLLGAAAGWLLTRSARYVRERSLLLPLVAGSILLLTGLAGAWELSPLLTAISAGFSARFYSPSAGERLFEPMERLEELVFVVFFTLAGAHLELQVFQEYPLLILGYFLARIAGKMAGGALGARAAGAPPQVVRWLGLGLVPQAGVAVGLALALRHQPGFEATAALVVNLILGTTLLYELIGPLATRFALARAGELGSKRGGARR